MNLRNYVTVYLGVLFAVVQHQMLAAEVTTSRRALLIACSIFPDAPNVKSLPGAENDVARFEQLLSSPKYQFQSIEKLAGWTEGSDRNPTAANIAAAFQRLIASSHQDDQVFILMSGHGTQVEAIADEQESFGISEEPDGKDEAFIAADYGTEQRVIRDDTIGQWLQQLKAKGAHVWIVFDCCHSGSMTRAAGDEEPRRLLAANTPDANRTKSAPDSSDTGIVDLSVVTKFSQGNAATTGSVVALFAAQNFETTPEMTRPIGAVALPENKRGLLSYHLEYLLNNLSGKATYRDIENALANRYYSERGMRGPNPYLEGDIDRAVFGVDQVEQIRSLELKRQEQDWELVGGIVDGVSIGTQLSVYANDKLIGTVTAEEVGLNRSTVSWIEPPIEGKDSIATTNSDGFPFESLRCEITKQRINPWKIAVRWVSVSDAASPLAQPLQQWIADEQERTESMIHDATERYRLGQSGDAWNICIATPETARSFGIEITGTSLILMNDAAFAMRDGIEPPSGNEIHVAYSAENFATLKESLTADFEKLFRMQRIYQLAGLYGDGGPMLSTRGVSLEFTQLNDPDKIVGHGGLESGDEIAVQLRSTKPKTLWYTILLIQSNGLIAPIQSGAIEKGNSSRPTRLEIEKIRLRPTQGNAAYVAVTVPVLEQRRPADFSYLAQLAIGMNKSDGNSATRGNETEDSTTSSTTLGGLFSLTTRRSETQLAIKDDGSQIAVRSWCVTP